MPALTELIKAIGCLPPEPDTPFTDNQWLVLNSHISDPEPRSLSDVYDNIKALETAAPRVRLIAILACLKGTQKLESKSEHVQKLTDLAAAYIAPFSRRESGSSGEAADRTEEYEDAAQRVRDVAIYGLEILRICSADYGARLSHDTLLTLIAFTDNTPAELAGETPATDQSSTLGREYAPRPQPWVTANASELAGRVLAEQLSRTSTADTLITTMLREYLRPLFSKSRSAAVTAAGRKAEFRDERDVARGLRDETGEVKPWKFWDHRAIAVFRWAVHAASETLISQQWPMFIPVLLTILDDGTTRVRYIGLVILPTFLRKFPDNILHDTGLASVFEDAVFPTLHFLPSITSEAESIQLLAPAYQSLLVLSRKLDLKVRSGTNASRTPRGRLLDRMLRDGVFSGYSHAKEHARVALLLFRVTAGLVKDMGINSVKHLKDLIPMHCEVLTDPFAVAAPELLEVVAYSLCAVVSTCWPRLNQPPYQDELIKALVTCFLNVRDDPESDGKLKQTEERLVILTQMLSALGKHPNGSRLKDKVAPLIAKEPVLQTLFTDP